jgi:hypothetical protein
MGKLLQLNDRLRSRPPAETDFAYLAGIMDGEGYFCASVKSNAFGMRVKMLDAEAIDWLHATFGGQRSSAEVTKRGRVAHVWLLQRQADLLVVLPRIAPYLRIKQPRAEAMLALIRHLQARPVFAVPSRRRTQEDRARLDDALGLWRARSVDLRGRIAAAHHMGVNG